AFAADRNLAALDARLRLRPQHDELAADLLHHPPIVFHHAMATFDVAGAAIRTRLVNLRVSRVGIDLGDRHPLLRREHALPFHGQRLRVLILGLATVDAERERAERAHQRTAEPAIARGLARRPLRDAEQALEQFRLELAQHAYDQTAET